MWSQSNHIIAFALELKPYTVEHLSKGVYINMQEKFLYTHVYCSSHHNSWTVESAEVPIKQWMDKENMAHIWLSPKESESISFAGK
jgi:hypothetical protein